MLTSIGFTNLWRFYHTLRGNIHIVNHRTHERYGPVVRTGPNNLDLAIPSLIKTIYSTDNRWLKTEFYETSSSLVDGRVTYNLFSLRDPAEHARQKRPVAKLYAMGEVLALEPHIDSAIRQLCDGLDKLCAGDGEWTTCDLSKWIKFCEFNPIYTCQLLSTSAASDTPGRCLGRHQRGDV